MRNRTFVDTNVFLYTLDSADPAKAHVALTTLEALGDQTVISTQVLNEFCSAAKRKLAYPHDKLKKVVADLARIETVAVDSRTILAALDLSFTARINYFDALMVQSAVQARCRILLSEDMGHGQRIAGVLIQNPFASPG